MERLNFIQKGLKECRFPWANIPRLVLEEKEENTKEQEEEQKTKNKELDNWLEEW